MKFGALHHIEMNVSNLKRSVEFWRWILERLGYQPYQDWREGKSWKLHETYLVFVQTQEKFLVTTFHRKHVGLNHLAFHVETKAQVDDIIIELKKRDIAFLYPDAYPKDDWYAVYFEDPDRIKVEIVAS